jgi:hypothetical protein
LGFKGEKLLIETIGVQYKRKNLAFPSNSFDSVRFTNQIPPDFIESTLIAQQPRPSNPNLKIPHIPKQTLKQN